MKAVNIKCSLVQFWCFMNWVFLYCQAFLLQSLENFLLCTYNSIMPFVMSHLSITFAAFTVVFYIFKKNKIDIKNPQVYIHMITFSLCVLTRIRKCIISISNYFHIFLALINIFKFDWITQNFDYNVPVKECFECRSIIWMRMYFIVTNLSCVDMAL